MNAASQLPDGISLVPDHIAVIMDGNGRWALERGFRRTDGHRNGVEAVRQTAEGAARLGVNYLTLYAFSTENWSRPQEEVDALMELLVRTIKEELPTLNKNNIALQAIGQTQRLPHNCQNQLRQAINDTAHNDGMILILALSYSGRSDLTQAARNITEAVKAGRIKADGITEDLIKQHLTTAPYPDPDILLRTGGEQRISNFLLWESAYTEFIFVQKNWPDFREEDLHEAVRLYNRRERRFGKTGEQIRDLV